ncbi:MAG: hypothetical protein RMJ82_15120, partial [Gemmatales bacterium]|nr:hypothetical protein [Gemmatales bacterium]
NNPVVQEHLGDIQSCSINWSETIAERQQNHDSDKQRGLWAFNLVGTRGKALVRVKIQGTEGPYVVKQGTLEIENGNRLDLYTGLPK